MSAARNQSAVGYLNTWVGRFPVYSDELKRRIGEYRRQCCPLVGTLRKLTYLMGVRSIKLGYTFLSNV